MIWWWRFGHPQKKNTKVSKSSWEEIQLQFFGVFPQSFWRKLSILNPSHTLDFVGNSSWKCGTYFELTLSCGATKCHTAALQSICNGVGNGEEGVKWMDMIRYIHIYIYINALNALNEYKWFLNLVSLTCWLFSIAISMKWISKSNHKSGEFRNWRIARPQHSWFDAPRFSSFMSTQHLVHVCQCLPMFHCWNFLGVLEELGGSGTTLPGMIFEEAETGKRHGPRISRSTMLHPFSLPKLETLKPSLRHHPGAGRFESMPCSQDYGKCKWLQMLAVCGRIQDNDWWSIQAAHPAVKSEKVLVSMSWWHPSRTYLLT